MGVHQTQIGLESVEGQNWTGKKVLDIGCGNGQLTIDVYKKTSQSSVVGIDINSGDIDKARELFRKQKIPNASFYAADASDLSLFKEKTFDIIFCNIAFQQFDYKQKSLAEMYRVLKPQGEVFINFIEEKSEVRKTMDRIVSESPLSEMIPKIGKGKKISRKEFNQMGKNSGFKILSSTSINHEQYYPTISALFYNYQNFDVVFPALKKLPKEKIDFLWKQLKSEFTSLKTKEGFGETWKVAIVKLTK